MVQPGAVYITFPTELGTLYSKKELEAVHAVCEEYSLPLFIDGARMGYGLMADECDFDIAWLARHCEAFYFGGTKVGALCGEAIVFPKGNTPRNLFTTVKRHGALLAKSRLVGVQFDALFTDNLYFSISRHAIRMAHELRKTFIDAGFKMANQSPTNQQFVIVPASMLEPLRKHVVYEVWEHLDHKNTVCRFVTSWATTEDEIRELAQVLKNL